VRGKAVRRNDVIDRSLNARRPEAPLDAQLAGLGRYGELTITALCEVDSLSIF
jgi:hypothetical protein